MLKGRKTSTSRPPAAPGFEGRQGGKAGQVLQDEVESVERCHAWMLPCDLVDVLSPAPDKEINGGQPLT